MYRPDKSVLQQTFHMLFQKSTIDQKFNTSKAHVNPNKYDLSPSNMLLSPQKTSTYESFFTQEILTAVTLWVLH